MSTLDLSELIQRSRAITIQATETIRRTRDTLRVSRAVQADRERADARRKQRERRPAVCLQIVDGRLHSVLSASKPVTVPSI